MLVLLGLGQVFADSVPVASIEKQECSREARVSKQKCLKAKHTPSKQRGSLEGREKQDLQKCLGNRPPAFSI